MSFIESIKTCFSQYVTFSGRARRPEFWWFALFAFVGTIIMAIIDIKLFGTTVIEPGSISGQTSFAPFTWVFMLAIMLPYISVAVRRLHDIGRSGWWYWIGLIPVVGIILLIVWFAKKSDSGPNRFGPEPAA